MSLDDSKRNKDDDNIGKDPLVDEFIKTAGKILAR